MDPNKLREQLREHGEARQAAAKTQEIETAAIRKLVPKAIAAGLTKVEIAKLAQISRVTVDAMLD